MAETISRPVVDTPIEQPLLEQPAPPVMQPNGPFVSELTSYLANLGLGDAHLAKVHSLVEAAHGDVAEMWTAPPEAQQGPFQSAQTTSQDQASRSGDQPVHAGQPLQPATGTGKKTITIYVAEEQQILREAYQSFFSTQSGIEVLASSGDTSAESLVEAASNLEPDVMLIGVKAIQPDTVENLEILRDACPRVGLVLLFAFSDDSGITALREFSRDVSVGRAYLLKHTVDTVEQLTQAIYSVAEGRIIVDPTVMEALVSPGDGKSGILKDLSPRALEVLGWVARGYRNDSIADVLSRDVKTIERHINNIYSTLLGTEEEPGHPRVRAALMCLRATGLLSTEQPFES